MDLPPRGLRGTRIVLFVGVGLNLLGSALLALEFFVQPNNCNFFGTEPYYLFCATPVSAYGWFWGTITICSALPLLGLAGPRLALIGVVSQATLLFLSIWTIFNWGLVPLFFSVIGGLLGLWASGRVYRKGVPGPPLALGLTGATWAGLVALWMVYLLYTPNFLPITYPCAPGGTSSGCETTLATAVPATQLAFLAIVLATYVALLPFGRPRFWPVGAAGALGVIASGILLPPYFFSLTPFAILSGLVLLTAAAGCVEFAKTGRTIWQALDPPESPNGTERTYPPQSHGTARVSK
ncbi:MAG: hypothetical protein L3J97_02415 [Thermoplasmata archaeon]|nr:hypothetical protein [Thermoplasmata archaeon]